MELVFLLLGNLRILFVFWECVSGLGGVLVFEVCYLLRENRKESLFVLIRYNGMILVFSFWFCIVGKGLELVCNWGWCVNEFLL